MHWQQGSVRSGVLLQRLRCGGDVKISPYWVRLYSAHCCVTASCVQLFTSDGRNIVGIVGNMRIPEKEPAPKKLPYRCGCDPWSADVSRTHSEDTFRVR